MGNFEDYVWEYKLAYVEDYPWISPNVVYIGEAQEKDLLEQKPEVSVSEAGEMNIHGMVIRKVESDNYINVGVEK
tara:strand:+ start:172 stop:396 length:225 start_codon:yes stop_codon:yes gene_type:complete